MQRKKVIGIFGFHRTIYGTTKEKWWMELRTNRTCDIDAEGPIN